MRHAFAIPALLLACSSPVLAAEPRVLDDFSDASRWSAAPSSGVELKLSSEPSGDGGRALCLAFDFHGKAGYAAARRAIPLELPSNFAFSFRMKGDAPSNTFEFKLSDASGDNVWWVPRRNVTFPHDWQPVRYKRRHVEFAWGPSGGGDPKTIAFVEFTITAGTGGKGTVCFDRLALTPLPPARPYSGTPVASASSSAPGAGPIAPVLGPRTKDGAARGWHSQGNGPAWLAADFGEPYEFGGVVIDWDPADFARRFAVEVSDDGRTWRTLREVAGARGGTSYVPLPESEARHLRVRLDESARGQGFGVKRLAVRPLEFGATPEAAFYERAADAPRGTFPRWLSREASYWTIVGVDGGGDAVALLGADGALEPYPGSFSVEPLLRVDGQFATWSSVTATPSKPPTGMPMPTVRWSATNGVTLAVTAFANGTRDASTLYARYDVENGDAKPHKVELALAVRPFQVNPPWQFLGTAGGMADVADLEWDGASLLVNKSARVIPLTPGARFGAGPLAGGEIGTRVLRGDVPADTSVHDPERRASGALTFGDELASRSAETFVLAFPRGRTRIEPLRDSLPSAGMAWRDALERVRITGPAAAEELATALRANLGYILVERAGPGLRPGSRSYARSWIRDGALMSEALLRLGHADAVKEFLAWFAAYQFDDGKVPCCVDARGADPVPENDSHGEFIWTVSEYERFTGDRDLVRQLWPQVARAAEYLDRLRLSRRTPEYASGEKQVFYGLLPESISHEGYSAKPMHSYWDDAWGLLGFEEAARLAGLLGEADAARRFTAMADEFRADVLQSITRVMAAKNIAYVPGCAELGDFDATSTAIALSPGSLLGVLPHAAVKGTFDRYWEFADARRNGTKEWKDYTPYEWRIVGSLVRLGERERAQALIAFLMDGRRPAAWNQWPEIVWHDEKAPKFLGDLPHAWVGAEFIRSVLDLFAWERKEDGALVLAAGIPAAWLKEGVRLDGLRTAYGPLMYSLSETTLKLPAGLKVPPGGFVAKPPLAPKSVTVNGKELAPNAAGEYVVREVPAEVVFR